MSKNIAVCDYCGHEDSNSTTTFCRECGFDSVTETTMKTIAVYGSLKRGKYNHTLIENCTFLGDTTIKGTLYSLGSYPAIIEDGDNEYPAEVYEVPDEIYERVRRMELGAGYKEVIVDGNIVYYADEKLREYCLNSNRIIESY